MTWQAVARKDFRDAIRSRWLWALSVVFVFTFSLPAIGQYVLGNGAGGGSGIVQFAVFTLKEGTAILVPLMAVVVAYTSITGERESGTLKLLLALPHARDDVIAGKVVGRSLVIAVPVVVGFLLSILFLLPGSSAFDWVTYVQFGLLTAYLGVVFVGISVGCSAVADSNRQAILGAGGAFGLFMFLWSTLVAGVVDGFVRAFSEVGVDVATTTRYEAVLFLKLFNPLAAYRTLVNSLFGPAVEARKQMFGFFLFGDPKAAEAIGDSLALPFTDPFVLLYMLFWMLVPLAFGVVWFREKDL